jgi:hypothetical protein
MPQRDNIKELTNAPWLRVGNAEKFLYTFGVGLDALAEKMDQATRAHMPGEALTETAIPYQAEDRLLVQGPAETNDEFIPRLQRALDSWRKAGSRESILEQLKAYRSDLDPGVVVSDPSMLIVGGTSAYTTWDSCTFGDAPETPPSHRRQAPGNWNWDGSYKSWRAWLVLFMRAVATGQSGAHASVTAYGGSGVSGVTSGFATITGLAGMTSDNLYDQILLSGSASAGNNGSFQIVKIISATSVMVANPKGVASDANNGAISWVVSRYPFFAPPLVYGAPDVHWGDAELFWGIRWAGHDVAQTVTSIRQILKRWKSGRTYYPNILISFDGGDGTQGNQFSPLSAKGSGNPNGDYGDYGSNVNGVWVPRAPGYPLTAFLDGTGQYARCNVHNVT